MAASIYSDAVGIIAAGRSLSADRVRELVDSGPRTAAEALEARLVDRLGYRDEVLAALRERTDPAAELLFADRWRPRPQLRLPGRHRQHLALVEVRGGIGPGRSRNGPMGTQAGSDTVATELRAALADDHVRGVVLRVDSPGGSAVASDVIWREVCRVREAGKPVVVSMGDVAASGGYYVACPADRIVALPSTLTGSIGVLGGKFVTSELWEKVGLDHRGRRARRAARMWSARRGFTDDERERLNAEIDAIYADFVAKVAAGRGRTVADVEPLARGRVWTGATRRARPRRRAGWVARRRPDRAAAAGLPMTHRSLRRSTCPWWRGWAASQQRGSPSAAGRAAADPHRAEHPARHRRHPAADAGPAAPVTAPRLPAPHLTTPHPIALQPAALHRTRWRC